MSIFRSRTLPFVILFCLTLSWGIFTPTFYAHAGCPLAKHNAQKSCENSGGNVKGELLAMLVIAALLLLMRKNSEKTQEGLGDEGEDYYEEVYYTVYDLADYCEVPAGDDGNGDGDDTDKDQTGDGTSDKTSVGQTTDESETDPGETYTAVADTYFNQAEDGTLDETTDRLLKRRTITTARAAEGTTYGIYVQTAGVAAIRGQSEQAKAIARAPNLVGISRQNTGAQQQNLYTLGNETLVTANRARVRALRAIDTVDKDTISQQLKTTGGAQ